MAGEVSIFGDSDSMIMEKRLQLSWGNFQSRSIIVLGSRRFTPMWTEL